MSRKLDYILLIDDDEATNFFNQIVLEEAGVAKQIKIVESGQEALEFLQTKENGNYPRPELIFLDINMPGMDGWDFLKAYADLSDEYKGNIIVVMLTTSLNPEDKEKANSMPDVTSFQNKPLTQAKIDEIISKHFVVHE